MKARDLSGNDLGQHLEFRVDDRQYGGVLKSVGHWPSMGVTVRMTDRRTQVDITIADPATEVIVTRRRGKL